MLWKILITTLVVVAAFAYLKRRSRLQQAARQQHRVNEFLGHAGTSSGWRDNGTGDPTLHRSLASRLRLILWIVLTLILLAGSIYSFFQWRDQQGASPATAERTLSGSLIFGS
ncbi:MAG TPA: hypothetical protein DEG76_10745 [Pseudohongiella sp.]|nr:hypothetical protein [Pseudohongiella sp.]HBX37727.1 hypothetical protein [Pseudohongiella sp.]|tara:strand:+ start:2733 stop:3071 length:339 start_codon:yes stop_codon:yes gene_type:complete